MGKIITVNIQKGGSGKSTTTQALTSCLSSMGNKCLIVDLDHQGNVSYSSGIEYAEKTTYEFLKGEISADEAIQRCPEFDIIPANILLSGADMEFTKTGREYLLKDKLEELKNKYDYIILDTPPSLGILSVNSLTAADYVVIPTEATFYSLQGMGQLYNTIESVRRYCNKDLKILGLLLIKYNNRTILSRQVKDLIEDTARQMNTKVFKQTIREGIAVKEAQAQQESLLIYAPNSNPSLDYLELTKEIVKEIENV